MIESANLKIGQWKVLNLRNEGKRLNESEQNVRDPQDTSSRPAYIVGASKTGERERGSESI